LPIFPSFFLFSISGEQTGNSHSLWPHKKTPKPYRPGVSAIPLSYFTCPFPEANIPYWLRQYNL